MSLTLLAPIEPAASAETAPSLTADQKRLIRDSFTTVEPASDLVARLFYMKSIDLDPSLGVLFKTPTRGQRRRFMAAMKLAILSLDRLQELQPIIKLLIAQKRQEGVGADAYATFRRAWVWTLEQSLQGRFPHEAREAWTSLLSQMTEAEAS
jgi:hemoglobin-like flavoprotein